MLYTLYYGFDQAVLLVHGKFRCFTTLATLQLLAAMHCVHKVASAIILTFYYCLGFHLAGMPAELRKTQNDIGSHLR